MLLPRNINRPTTATDSIKTKNEEAEDTTDRIAYTYTSSHILDDEADDWELPLTKDDEIDKCLYPYYVVPLTASQQRIDNFLTLCKVICMADMIHAFFI